MTADEHPEGVSSLFDTDLYKLTMQCAVLKYFPDVNVEYKFTNRTPHMRLTREAYNWLRSQIDKLEKIRVTEDESAWLRKTCPYFTSEYLDFLQSFTLQPKEQVKTSFTPTDDSGHESDSTPGDVSLTVHGGWKETILYEIPLLALTSEAYFKFVARDWTHDGQLEKAKQKGLQLLEGGCVFSEFGSRRRRDYKTHDIVIQGLLQAKKESEGKDWKGAFTGTSNVHLAMRYGLTPIGTVAHEWFMGIAAVTQDYANANEQALQYWTGTFGRGVLSIALTDTFGTPAFLRAFAKPAPTSGHTSDAQPGLSPSYAKIFTGVRQDSGDPLDFISLMRRFYTDHNISDKKTIVFSDSLTVEKAMHYKHATEKVGLTATFGVGTFFTNDFVHTKTGEKSVPLNIVIKVSKANGNDAIKLSDDVGKNMGEKELVRKVKEQVGYEDKRWVGGDEAHRWDK
ncbi:Putative nicotinate phosphoribosyltransferase family [Septoria linicola]|uniref:Nicotinate phosphoribosyltransferase n=1 Tax=Septoria linicola TaxID=215465 RepID=A0A9Q9AGL2_9PEZI|nr:Putative nicotinate phosphoribosyltransferase family [Septoria linicola]